MEAALKLRARGRAPCSPPGDIHVLKFGSSVLARPEDYPAVARAIGREVTRGRKVVAVVSAMGNTTDSLLAAARSVTPESPDRLMGALLATGEEASVALLTLALAAERVRAVGFNAWRLPLRTRGSLRDADPVAVDTTRIHAVLGDHDAIVFPGFVGVDETGVPSLLGRGGSDLTALFLGDALGAAEIRLVKDFDGIFPADPRCGRGSGGPHQTSGSGVRTAVSRSACPTLTWCQARTIGGGVVQPKAIDFAELRGLGFRVTGLSGKGTSVGRPRRWQVAR